MSQVKDSAEPPEAERDRAGTPLEPSREDGPPDTFVSGFWPAEQARIHLSHLPPSLWQFVMAALGK